MRNVMIVIASLLFLGASTFAFAQEVGFGSHVNVQNEQEIKTPERSLSAEGDASGKKASPKVGESSAVDWLSSFEFWMSFSVLVFGILVFVIEIIMVRLTKFQPEQTIKLLAVTLIVISTLFIITAGFDSEQIAPAMGLFGTIAGYMLGRASGKPGEAQE